MICQTEHILSEISWKKISQRISIQYCKTQLPLTFCYCLLCLFVFLCSVYVLSMFWYYVLPSSLHSDKWYIGEKSVNISIECTSLKDLWMWELNIECKNKDLLNKNLDMRIQSREYSQENTVKRIQSRETYFVPFRTTKSNNRMSSSWMLINKVCEIKNY